MFRERTTGRGAATTPWRRAKVGDLNVILHALLGRVRQDPRFPGVIADDVKIEDEYSVSRSLKRGATSQARNQKVPQDVIEENNRWRKKERAQGRTPHMSLLERYADARASIPLLVQFSQSL